MPFYLSPPAGNSGVALGAAQNRRWYSARRDPARLADHLPRRERNGAPGQRRPRPVLLGRGDVAIEGAPPGDPLSFPGARVDATAVAGTPRDYRQRRVPNRHRPARRSRLTGPLRCLLWDGRLPDWRGTR